MKVGEKWLEAHELTQADIDEGRHPGPALMGGLHGRFRSAAAVQEQFQAPARDDIQDFRDLVEEFNPQFFDVGQQFIDIGRGTATDPLIEAQRARGIEGLRGRLSRQGARGSVALNEINRANLGFDELRLGARETALDRGFGLQSIGLQTAAGIPALSIAELMARMSGRGGDGGGGKSCFIICLILTEELLFAGLLSLPLFLAHVIYAADRYSQADYAGYRRWADPLVTAMSRFRWLRRAVGWAMRHYTEEAAYRVGLGGRSNIVGKIFAFLIPSLSRMAGRLC